MSKFQVGDRVIFKNPLPGSRRTCGEVINIQKGPPVVHVKVRGRGEFAVPETQLYINAPIGDDNDPILPQGCTSSSINSYDGVAISVPPFSMEGV